MTDINNIQIVYAKNIEEARRYITEGYCPIEVTFGDVTIVDELQMDHHGSLSHLSPVSIRAYSEHFGARADEPKFVVTGNPGADDVFAILALAGCLPHPSRQAPDHLKARLQQDLTDLAEFIAKLDRDPVGVNKADHKWGPLLITWGAMTEGPNGIIRHFASIYEMWRLIELRPLHTFFNAAKEEDQDRRKKAKDAAFEMFGLVKFLPDSPVPAPDVYHERLTDDTDPDSPEGWAAPVVVTYVERGKNYTIATANKAVAIALFGNEEGKEGLKSVFAQLGGGHGGAENVGGSPRGQEMTAEQAREIAQKIAEILKSK